MTRVDWVVAKAGVPFAVAGLRGTVEDGMFFGDAGDAVAAWVNGVWGCVS